MEIRELRTLEECQAVVALEKDVWGYADSEDVVPAAVMVVTVKRGGILLGAFDEAGVMKGFVYSWPALKDRRAAHWSHMLGVTASARNTGLGVQLKLAQRQRALQMGIDLIEWTFDPLQALNAHLNFTKLGVVVEEYEVNVYGESSSPLHRGSPTDRFVAEWRLTEPHVARRIAARATGLVRDASVAAAPVVNPPAAGRTFLRPGAANLSHDERRLLVEIPGGYSDMLVQDPALALDWRLATRAIFLHYFEHGYRAVDFFLAANRSRGQYLLVKAEVSTRAGNK